MAFLPAIPTCRPVTDQECAEFCAEHPDRFFEMTSEGELVVMLPRFTMTGARNLENIGRLRNGPREFPSGARRSPDAAWTVKAKTEAMAGVGCVKGEGPVEASISNLTTVWNPIQ